MSRRWLVARSSADGDRERPARETQLKGSLGRLARGQRVGFISGADIKTPGALDALLDELDRQASGDIPDCPECNRWDAAAMLALSDTAYVEAMAAIRSTDPSARATVAARYGLKPPPPCVAEHLD